MTYTIVNTHTKHYLSRIRTCWRRKNLMVLRKSSWYCVFVVPLKCSMRYFGKEPEIYSEGGFAFEIFLTFFKDLDFKWRTYRQQL